VAIVAGGLVLSWSGNNAGSSGGAGPALVGLACLCWAIDNNLTRKVSASDALFIAGSKGLVAGTVNTLLAVLLGAHLPDRATLLGTMTVGLLGYGVSLVMFILALRGLGTARSGAYFAIAPFLGAAIGLFVFGETAHQAFWLAALLMGAGVWLHLTERHEHTHNHEPLTHEHTHVHDEHHQHEHVFGWETQESHRHVHHHGVIRHSHPHFPDVHHRHRH
jgi:drug/metabolite transporter (DMT)-like permease